MKKAKAEMRPESDTVELTLKLEFTPRLRAAVDRYTRLKAGELFAVVYGTNEWAVPQMHADKDALIEAFVKLVTQPT